MSEAQAPTRIYLVKVTDQNPRLVRASHPAAALAHVVKGISLVRRASQEDLVTFLQDGVRVEVAGEDPAE